MNKESPCAVGAAFESFPGIGTYEWYVAEDRLVWSPQLLALYGLTATPDKERGFTDLVHPDDRLRVEGETSAIMGSATRYEHEFRIIRPDGEVRVVHDRGIVERAPDGSPLVVRGINIDVTSHRDPESEPLVALRATAQRLQLACEASGIGAWDADLRSGRSVWTPQMYDLLGISAGEPTSPEAFFSFVHPEDVDRLRSSFRQAVLARTAFSEEFRIVRRDGTVRHVVGKGQVVQEDGGEPVRVIGVNYDITRHKEVGDRAALLLREADHRSKNILSLVLAMARRTLHETPRAALARFEQRVQALAHTQDLLFSTDWDGISLEELARRQLAHLNGLLGTRITVAGPEVKVTAEAGQTIAMVLHELSTNAEKYGALSNESGRIDLWWEIHGAAEARRLTITWVERDGPPVEPPTHRGFGSTVLGSMARSALKAQVSFEYAPEGLTWRAECGGHCLVAPEA